jgi:hypothetical protein
MRAKIVTQLLEECRVKSFADKIEVTAPKIVNKATLQASNVLMSLSSSPNNASSNRLPKFSVGDSYVVRHVENNSLGLLHSLCKDEIENKLFVLNYFISIEQIFLCSADENMNALHAIIINNWQSVNRVTSLLIASKCLPVFLNNDRRPLLAKLENDFGVIFPMEWLGVKNRYAEVW